MFFEETRQTTPLLLLPPSPSLRRIKEFAFVKLHCGFHVHHAGTDKFYPVFVYLDFRVLFVAVCLAD